MENDYKKKSLLADISLFIVAIFWGGGFIAVKDALSSLTPFYIMAMRFGISVIIMLLIFRKKIKLITKNVLKVGVLIGLLLFLGFAAQTVGMKYTTAGKNAFLTGTNVVIVPFSLLGNYQKETRCIFVNIGCYVFYWYWYVNFRWGYTYWSRRQFNPIMFCIFRSAYSICGVFYKKNRCYFTYNNTVRHRSCILNYSGFNLMNLYHNH